jgi:hypothetical protein
LEKRADARRRIVAKTYRTGEVATQSADGWVFEADGLPFSPIENRPLPHWVASTVDREQDYGQVRVMPAQGSDVGALSPEVPATPRWEPLQIVLWAEVGRATE